MPTCFIAMPISTASPSIYGDDQSHFMHVLDHLFVPAIKAAGFDPVKPMAEGSDLIHAEIIRNIEQADLLLCDMSALNPNVFFELGIRTALNKPVCIVKDNLTPKVPFDTGILNHLEYISSLSVWTLDEQIRALAQHVSRSAERSSGRNSLWRYFGLSTSGELTHVPPTDSDRIDLLSQRIEGLASIVTREQEQSDSARSARIVEPLVMKMISELARATGTYMSGVGLTGNRLSIRFAAKPTEDVKERMATLARSNGYDIHFFPFEPAA
jgi:hypothetical protein